MDLPLTSLHFRHSATSRSDKLTVDGGISVDECDGTGVMEG